MTKKENGNDEFLQSVKEQLYMETFITDVPEYSEEKIDALVKIIDVTEGTDEKEADESYERFMDRFDRIAAKKEREEKKEKKKNHHVRYRKRFAQGVAAILAIFLVADVTSYAFMDAGLMHVIGRWTNQVSILPGETEVDIGYLKSETIYFKDVKAFADYFADDFLVCSWLPEEIRLQEISCVKMMDSCNYLWIYNDDRDENVLGIRMYEKVDNDLAGLTGSEIEDGEHLVFSNGIEAVLYRNSEGYMAVFEFNNWWYTVHGFSDERMLKLVVERMVHYE